MSKQPAALGGHRAADQKDTDMNKMFKGAALTGLGVALLLGGAAPLPSGMLRRRRTPARSWRAT